MPDLKEYRKIHAEPSQCRESALNSSSESKSGEDCRSEACSLYIREKLYAQKKKQKKKQPAVSLSAMYTARSLLAMHLLQYKNADYLSKI